jgi:hypothetical protein
MIVHYMDAASATEFIDEQAVFFNDMLSNMDLD